MGIVPAQMRKPKNYSKIRRQFPEKYLSLRSDDKNTWSNSPTADPKEGDRLHWGGKEQGVHLLMMTMMMTMMGMVVMMVTMMGLVVMMITRFVLNLLSAACTAASKEEASKSCRKIFKVIFSWSLLDFVIIFLSSSKWSLLDVVIIITIIIVIWTIMTDNVILISDDEGGVVQKSNQSKLFFERTQLRMAKYTILALKDVFTKKFATLLIRPIHCALYLDKYSVSIDLEILWVIPRQIPFRLRDSDGRRRVFLLYKQSLVVIGGGVLRVPAGERL